MRDAVALLGLLVLAATAQVRIVESGPQAIASDGPRDAPIAWHEAAPGREAAFVERLESQIDRIGSDVRIAELDAFTIDPGPNDPGSPSNCAARPTLEAARASADLAEPFVRGLALAMETAEASPRRAPLTAARSERAPVEARPAEAVRLAALRTPAHALEHLVEPTAPAAASAMPTSLPVASTPRTIRLRSTSTEPEAHLVPRGATAPDAAFRIRFRPGDRVVVLRNLERLAFASAHDPV